MKNVGHGEAVAWMFPTRSADEPTTRFYRCQKCKYTWRVLHIRFKLELIVKKIKLTFGAKTSGSDDLKAIISAISTLVEEATFVATA